MISLETGIRRGECFPLQWPAVDWSNSEITIRGEDPKSRTTRIVHLSTTAKTVLRDWWMQNGQSKKGYVFTHPDGAQLANLRKPFDSLLKRADIKKRTLKGSASWHGLRHTFGSAMVRRTDLETVRDLMGHASVTTTAQYLHTDEDRKRAAIKQGSVV